MDNLIKDVKKPSLKSSFSWTLVGNLFHSFSQFMIIIMLTKYGDVKMVGQYILGLAITAPIFLFTNLQLRVLFITDVDNKYSFFSILKTRCLTVLISFILVLFIINFGNYDNNTSVIILLVTLLKIIESFSDIIYSIYQKNEQMKFISISKIIKGFISILTIWLSMYMYNNGILTLVLLLIFMIISLFSVDIYLGKKYVTKAKEIDIKKLFRKFFPSNKGIKNFRTLLVTAIPLGIIATLDSFNVNIPRYFIQYSLGEEELGYFGSISYIMLLGGIVVGALGQAAMPRLSSYYKKDTHNYNRLLNKLVFIGFILGFLGFLFSIFMGELFLTILYSKEYASYTSLLNVIMLCGILWYVASFIETGIYATREFNKQYVIHVITIITSIISCIILIPAYGLMGAAFSMLISMVVRMFVGLYILHSVKRKNSLSGY